MRSMAHCEILICLCMFSQQVSSSSSHEEIARYEVTSYLLKEHNAVTLSDNLKGKRYKREVLDDTESTFISLEGNITTILLKLKPNTKLKTQYTTVEWIDDEETVANNLNISCFYIGVNVYDNDSWVAISNCNGLLGYIESNNHKYFIEPLGNCNNSSSGCTHVLTEITDIGDILNTTLSPRLKRSTQSVHSCYQQNNIHSVKSNQSFAFDPYEIPHNIRKKRNVGRRQKKIRMETRRLRRKGKQFRKGGKRLNKTNKKKRKYKQRRKKKKSRNQRKIIKNNQIDKSNSNDTRDLFSSVEWLGYSGDALWETETKPAYKETHTNKKLEIKPFERWLEVSIGVDYTVIDFHGSESVEQYILSLFNIVSAIYEDPSLEAQLNIVILRLIFYKSKKQSQIRKGFAKKSLEAVNRWAERLYMVSSSDMQHDMAVWLTKEQLGGPSGYAPVGGVCDPARSCTLNRDEGLTSAFIIAHEMAHVLGISHDGDLFAGNHCKDEGHYGSVMAPLVSATFARFHWSHCSKQEYHYLAPTWKCMEEASDYGNSVSSSTIHYQYSLDDQCRMEFGQGFNQCKTYTSSDPCTFLWCSNGTSHICKTKKGPPLEGTSCGDGMWCRYGFCEKMPEKQKNDFLDTKDTTVDTPPVRHNPQHGGWSDWSKWGFCSRTCGIGVTFRVRYCNNPKPKWGGTSCKGDEEEWKSCNANACPKLSDLRAEQCQLLRYLVRLGKRRSKLTWVPREHRKKERNCRLSCMSKATDEIYRGKEFVIDGTRCSYDDPTSICVQGKCHQIGCDGGRLSQKQYNKCGICGDNDNSCTDEKYVYAGVPYGDSGARFHYDRQMGVVNITALGPTIESISVMLMNGDMNETRTVTILYSMKRSDKFQWHVGPFSTCSVSCGGCHYSWIASPWEYCTATCGENGWQKRMVSCVIQNTRDQMTQDQRILVHPVNCQNSMKPISKRPCNRVACPGFWTSNDWSQCSTSCGIGFQQKTFTCVGYNNEDIFNCGVSYATENKTCMANECPNDECTDESRLCKSQSLERYCVIPKYRTQCCHSCARYLAHETSIL